MGRRGVRGVREKGEGQQTAGEERGLGGVTEMGERRVKGGVRG